MTSELLDQALSILLVEDSPEDAELLLMHLEGAGLKVSCHRVDTPEAMSKALANALWDLVISDYSLPRFNGMEALGILKATGIDIPFILVSGTIGEEVAVAALKAGAHDFIAKGKLTRLIPAIERELREAERRQKGRETEASLREMHEKLAAVGEAASDAILMTDNHFWITYWNPMAERMFGHSSPYALGRDLFSLVFAAECKGEFERFFQNAIFLGQEHASGSTLELTGRNKAGGEILLEISLSTVMLGGRWHAVAVLRDITERKRMELERLEQLQFLQTVIETVPHPFYFKDAERRFLGGNRAFLDYLGLPREEVIGRTLLECAPSKSSPLRDETDLKVLREGRSLTFEGELLLPDGSLGASIESKAPFFDIEGRVTGIVGTMLDITDRKRAEMEKASLEIQLRQAQKLEAIGQLAAGIAHEINTPTQFIGDNTIFLRDSFKDVLSFLQEQGELLKDDAQPTPDLMHALRELSRVLDLDYFVSEVPKAIEQMLDGVARVTRIVGAMKDFSHPGSEAKQLVDLNRSIESTLIISRSEWKYFADLETDYAPDLPPVPCFPSEFNQVILNLVINAAHAIQEARDRGNPELKGRIRVSTRHSGHEAVVRIEDNGTGIPEAIRQRIFEPFFTTKPIGKGTGQGLAIARGVIVDKHNGRLDLDSEVGKGTTFIISLPM